MISELEYHLSLMLLAVSAFNTMVVFMLLTISRSSKSPANRMLMVYLFCMATGMFMMFAIRSHLIINVAWLYRLPSPLYYLMFPSAYLYVRMILYDENRLRKTDWLHALPAVLHLIEYLPYHMLPMEVKQQVVERTLYDPLGGFGHEEGWMPTYAHNMLRGLLGVGYSVAMIRLLRKEYKRRPEKEAMFPELNRWLWVVALMLLVFSASLVVILCLPRVFSADVLAFSMYFWLSTPQIVTSLTLLGNPTILYGLPRPERPAVHEPVYDDSKKKKMPDPTLLDQYQYYLDTIHAFMGTQKPFLQQRYTLNDLAKDVQIPEHHISFVLNHLLNMRFNDFMNLSRIRYLEQRIQSEDVSHLSLEGLANEAGFGSRITFIRAVQRHTGRNPSDYFNVREPDNIPGEPGRQF